MGVLERLLDEKGEWLSVKCGATVGCKWRVSEWDLRSVGWMNCSAIG